MLGTGFPLWRTVRFSYTETFRNFDKLLKLAWVPFLLAFSASFLLDIAGAVRPPGLSQIPISGPLAVPILYTRMVIVECCLGIFALAMFRYRLLGWSAATDYVPLDIGKRELAFLGVAILVIAIDFGLWSVLIWARAFEFPDYPLVGSELLSLAVSLTSLIVLSRLCLTLAAISAGPKSSVNDARRLSLSDWGTLIALLLGTAGVFTVPGMITRNLAYFVFQPDIDIFLWAAESIGYQSAGLLHALFAHAVSLAISFVAIAVAVTAVSVAYEARTTRLSLV